MVEKNYKLEVYWVSLWIFGFIDYWTLGSWIASLVSITAYMMLIAKRRICFTLWIISNGFFIIHNFALGEYTYVILWIAYIALSMYGLLTWKA